MNKERVKEILCSPSLINVSYNNAPIYIEKLNEDNNTVNIYYIKHPEQKLEVPYINLMEM